MDANLELYVASYADSASAAKDFSALKDARGDDLVLVGAVVIDRDADGNVDVKEHGGGEVGGGAVLGGAGGLVVGLFAPPLLLATAVGAGIGAAIGGLVKKHEEKQLGVDVEEYLPPGSSAIVAVLDDQYLDGVDKALANSTKKINKAIDSGDYDKIKQAVSDAGDQVSDALDTDS
jgi:uncharacterized membrane protein